MLRERVVDATGLLEDGSALGVQGQVQGRVLDSAEFLPLPVSDSASRASATAQRPRQRTSRGRAAHPPPPRRPRSPLRPI